jgi:hypothetical protein
VGPAGSQGPVGATGAAGSNATAATYVTGRMSNVTTVTTNQGSFSCGFPSGYSAAVRCDQVDFTTVLPHALTVSNMVARLDASVTAPTGVYVEDMTTNTTLGVCTIPTGALTCGATTTAGAGAQGDVIRFMVALGGSGAATGVAFGYVLNFA